MCIRWRRRESAGIGLRSSITRERRRWGAAWLGLTLALAVHVTDEALTGFLAYWNPFVESVRESVAWSPLPTFSFADWLTGLVILLLVLIALSWPVFRGVMWMRPGSYLFASIMTLNGIGHLAGSLYLGRAAPGVYSTPLLLVGASLLLVSVRRYGVAVSRAKNGL